LLQERIALEIEWNDKDPFFDRDLNNFRLLFDLRVISVGIILTRGDELRAIFERRVAALGRLPWLEQRPLVASGIVSAFKKLYADSWGRAAVVHRGYCRGSITALLPSDY